MKTLTPPKFCFLSIFKKNKHLTSFLSLLLTVLFLNLTIGCSYYNVRSVTTSPETMANQIAEFNKMQQYAVIHSGTNIWHLNNLVLNEDNKTISGIAQKVESNHIPLKPRDSKRVHRYDKNKTPLNEVHFYTDSINIPQYGSEITIPFSEISSISVNDKNSGRSIANVFLGTIGVIAVILIIVAATKSSCPFIYVKDGEEFVFTGELYPGVLTANQQRDDYILLPNLKNPSNEYIIKITNELKEIQYTDFVQLLEITHPNNVTVLLDKNGIPQTFSELMPPKKVVVDNIFSNSDPILTKDNNSYLFDSELLGDRSVRDIQLHFNKSQQADHAKLFLTVKNSMWLDYVFGKFNEQFGNYYPKFQKDQQDYSKEKSENWVNAQNIPLSVYLKTTNGWELIDRIPTVGPMAFRDIAVPIDISKIAGDEVIVKLETGFMFWEVDYAGIDYTENVPLEITYSNPSIAVDGNGVDVTKLLSSEDQNYFVQPRIGDVVDVTFKTSEYQQDLKKTFFLKNIGYYNYIRDYKDDPNFLKLKLFKSDGAFTDFSKYEFEVLMDYQNQSDEVVINTK